MGREKGEGGREREEKGLNFIILKRKTIHI